jgi:hypothetical protein
MPPALPPLWTLAPIDAEQPAEREAVVRLRREAYCSAAEFRWRDPATLGWSAADHSGLVLGLWSGTGGPGAVLLSTLRLNVFRRASAAEHFLEHALSGVGVEWPALVLSRAATAPGQGRHGLMAMLRWAYLQAFPAAHLRGVLAVVFETAPRLHSMHRVGYRFTVPESSWDSEASALKPPLIAHLPAARLDDARAAALGLVESALPRLHSDGPALANALLRLALLAAPHETGARPVVPELAQAA